MRNRFRLWRGIFMAGLVLTLVPAATPPSTAAVACTAKVQASADSDQVWRDYVEKKFRLEISSQAQCGNVSVDLVATERLFNGEMITTTTRNWYKAAGSASTTHMFSYKMAPDSALVSWEFKVNRCVVCGTE